MYKLVCLLSLLIIVNSAVPLNAQDGVDTSYISIAPESVQKMLVYGKAPVFTLQVNGLFNIGMMDMADNDNTSFQQDDFVGGRNFGVRYGMGVSLTGKISLHKKGNVRLTVSPAYQRFQSDLIIKSKSGQGKVAYNIFYGGIGLENCFTPNRPFKPYVGAEIIFSSINGKATLTSDSTNLDLTIKNAFRIGGCINLGFEYAFGNTVGFNLGMKLANLNILLKDSKQSSSEAETYLNDEFIEPRLPYSGWKQMVYLSYNLGINFYFGMKNRK